MRHITLLLVAVLLSACSAFHVTPRPEPIPIEGAGVAERVLGTVATAAGSMKLVGDVALAFGLDFAWLTSNEADQIATIVRDHARSAIDGIHAAREGTWDGEFFVPAGYTEFIPTTHRVRIVTQVDAGDRDGLILIVNAAVDAVQGSLIQAAVSDSDPVGYGFGCGGMEHSRSLLTEWVLETGGDANGRVAWPRQTFDPLACRAQLASRADALIELSRATFTNDLSAPQGLEF